jgi:hypothetical protein
MCGPVGVTVKEAVDVMGIDLRSRAVTVELRGQGRGYRRQQLAECTNIRSTNRRQTSGTRGKMLVTIVTLRPAHGERQSGVMRTMNRSSIRTFGS